MSRSRLHRQISAAVQMPRACSRPTGAPGRRNDGFVTFYLIVFASFAMQYGYIVGKYSVGKSYQFMP